MVTKSEAAAETHAFIESYAKFAEQVGKFMSDFRTFRSSVIQLANDEVSLVGRVKEAEKRLREIDEQVAAKLASVSQGSRAIMERISEKELAADKMKRELEQKIEEVNRQMSEVQDMRRQADAALTAAGAI